MNRVGIILAAVILAALVAFAWLHQRTMIRGLPPRTVCASQVDALAQAGAYAKAHGGAVVPILGTGSMAPFLPAAPAGADPLATVVAYVVIDAHATFADIKPGALCIYRTEWSPLYAVMHQAAQQDGLGWIMSGLHNPRSEPGWRTTERNFVGLVACAFVWNTP